jgi:hypothetical protein
MKLPTACHRWLGELAGCEIDVKIPVKGIVVES